MIETPVNSSLHLRSPLREHSVFTTPTSLAGDLQDKEISQLIKETIQTKGPSILSHLSEGKEWSCREIYVECRTLT